MFPKVPAITNNSMHLLGAPCVKRDDQVNNI